MLAPSHLSELFTTTILVLFMHIIIRLLPLRAILQSVTSATTAGHLSNMSMIVLQKYAVGVLSCPPDVCEDSKILKSLKVARISVSCCQH